MTFFLSWNPLVVIVLVSFFLSLMIVMFHKFFTDQEKLKKIKDEIDDMRDKLKVMQKKVRKGDSDVSQDEMMSLQKKMMSKSFERTKDTMKVSLFTFIPIIFIFGFMNSHYIYESINPGDNFQMSVYMNDNVSLEIVSQLNHTLISQDYENELFKKTYSFEAKNKGLFVIDFIHNDSTFSKEVLVTDIQEYIEESKSFNSGVIDRISIDYEKLTPLGDISILGWNPGWLGVYIIFSIIFNMSLRKLLEVN